MIDLLIVRPSEDALIDKKKTSNMRIEKNLPNQETPNIGIAYMIAMAKKNNLVFEYVDMEAYEVSLNNLIKIIEKENPLVIGFNSYTVNFYSSAVVARKVKEKFPDKLICFGGPHVTALPIETLEENDFIDFIVCGEADNVMISIIKNLKKNYSIKQLDGVISKYNKQILKHTIPVLDNLPFPAWENFDLNKFPGFRPHETKLELPISTSRGCPFRCVFCAHNSGRGKRRRTPESIINELKYLIDKFGVEAIAFIDETFVLNLNQSKHLFNLLIETGLNKKIKWSCDGRVDIVEEGLFELMKESGCYGMFFGLESGDDNILKIAKKNINTEQIKKAVKMAKNAGLLTYGSFIIGLPGATEETVMKSINLGIEMDMYSTTFPIATPLPGTELREMALNGKYGMKLLSNDWSRYGKQDSTILESDDLSLEKRHELQKLAYKLIPKKNLHEYIQTRFKKI